MNGKLPENVEKAARNWCKIIGLDFDTLGPIGRQRVLDDIGEQPDVGSGGDALPPLPESNDWGGYYDENFDVFQYPTYTAEQMQEYARKAVAARQPVGVSDSDLHLAAQMLTWGRDEGLTTQQEREIEAHQKKLFDALGAGAPPAPAAVPAPYNAGGIELTACQLHEALLMAGDPEFDTDFEDRPRVRIFRTESGHSGPGLYCECVDVEEEGCILLDGTSPAIRQQRAPAAVPVDAVKLAESRGFNGAIRYVLGYFNGTGDRGSTAYEEILNACGREQIIRSAVEDGELEFTGLGWYVENYGTEQDRSLLATNPQPAAAKTGHFTTDEMLEATAVLRAQQAKPEVQP